MPKVKIPRKSTNVDMTAMCDVAFLLLSFFILATKQSHRKAVQYNTPSSVSTKAAPDKSIISYHDQRRKSILNVGRRYKKRGYH